jgi:hypothetical protein
MGARSQSEDEQMESTLWEYVPALDKDVAEIRSEVIKQGTRMRTTEENTDKQISEHLLTSTAHYR